MQRVMLYHINTSNSVAYEANRPRYREFRREVQRRLLGQPGSRLIYHPTIQQHELEMSYAQF